MAEAAPHRTTRKGKKESERASERGTPPADVCIRWPVIDSSTLAAEVGKEGKRRGVD